MSDRDFEVRARAEGWVKSNELLRNFSDNDLRLAGLTRVTRRQHNLHGTPRVGQVFWVDFPADAYAPEFENEHPGVVVRAARNMADSCIIVPLTHRAATANIHAYKLSQNPNPNDALDAWAICDHLYTVSLGRLRRFQRRGKDYDARLVDSDKQAIFSKIQRSLPMVFSTSSPSLPATPPAKPKSPTTLSLKKP